VCGNDFKKKPHYKGVTCSKPCSKIYKVTARNEYYQKNKLKISAYHKKYYEENRNKISIMKKEYHKKKLANKLVAKLAKPIVIGAK